MAPMHLRESSRSVASPESGEALARRVNRGARGRNARVRFESEVPFGPSLTVRRYRLGNGLNVLVTVDRSAPVISYQTWFRVGSRNERPGKTGLAHLFEHLMFNETSNLPAGEFDRLLEAAGGDTNAATWTDWTFYYENLPKSQLGLAVRLEADRMANLVLREPQVSSEKEVVANERRYRVDDDVEGTANERLYALAFKKHPYRWPTIGWMKDIEGFTTEDCNRFYRTYYAPNNATVVLVGDIDEQEALGRIQGSYGHLAPSRIPAGRKIREPMQRQERRLTLRLQTPTEKVQIGYRAPAFGDPDFAVMTVANEILFGGRSSRLYQLLVNDLELCSECRASTSPFREAGLYEVWLNMRPRRKAAGAVEVLDRELRRLMEEPVGQQELWKAKNRLELGFLQGMETAGGKAEQLGFYETVLDDASRVFERLEDYRRVTSRQIQAVARRTLMRRRRSVITIVPITRARSV